MNNQTNLLFGWKNWVGKNSVAVAVAAAAAEESVAVAVKESLVAAAVVAVAVEGGCDCYLLYRIYYFIVVDILFYCDVYIILLC